MATALDTSLNEQQLLMLKLFKKPLPEVDFIKMRNWLSSYGEISWTNQSKAGKKKTRSPKIITSS